MELKRTLGFFDVTMIVVSMVIGIGIFRNPSIIALKSGSETIFFTAWIVGAVISICGALTFAEIGSRFPAVGGYYKTFSYCYHPTLAFMLIWTYIALNAGSAAAVLFTGAQYIDPILFPAAHSKTLDQILFYAIIAILFTINYLGIKAGSRAQNILSFIKIVLMLVFISALFIAKPVAQEIAQPENTSSSTSSFGWIAALGTSLIAVFFSYGGYQNTSNLGAEVRSAKKNIPRAIITGMIIVMTLYLAINFTYVKILGFENVQHSPLIAADLGKALFGNAGSAFASVAIFISVLGFINASFLYNPRVMYAMAEEGVLPPVFMKLNEKRQVLEFSLIFFTAFVIFMFIILQTYENLLNYVEFNDTILLALAAACIFILRRKQKSESEGENEGEGYRVLWYPFIPVIFILVILGVTLNIIMSDPKNSLIGFIVMLCGYPLFLLMKKISGQALKSQ